ncbi:hypothetical protein C8J57DRAFT_1243268 [Mycena rebaudengoi]|nr:hypothetical protein C8J57DRAFT_1243268 [Mycena rebaudengoi]
MGVLHTGYMALEAESGARMVLVKVLALHGVEAPKYSQENKLVLNPEVVWRRLYWWCEGGCPESCGGVEEKHHNVKAQKNPIKINILLRSGCNPYPNLNTEIAALV